MTTIAPRRPRASVWLAAFAALTVLAALALPVAAWAVEAVATRAGNWILPVQVVAVVGVAAAVAWVRSTPAHRRPALITALTAAAAAVLVADTVWYFLLTGW